MGRVDVRVFFLKALYFFFWGVYIAVLALSGYRLVRYMVSVTRGYMPMSLSLLGVAALIVLLLSVINAAIFTVKLMAGRGRQSGKKLVCKFGAKGLDHFVCFSAVLGWLFLVYEVIVVLVMIIRRKFVFELTGFVPLIITGILIGVMHCVRAVLERPLNRIGVQSMLQSNDDFSQAASFDAVQENQRSILGQKSSSSKKTGKASVTVANTPVRDSANTPLVNFYPAHNKIDAEAELEALIGLESVKEQVRRFRALLEYERNHQASVSNRNYNMIFYGNPGTGKTTVAKIMAQILYREKRVRNDLYLSVNGNDLTGQYLGQTSRIVQDMFNAVRGGVLFIDEAYALTQQAKGAGGGSFGDEAISKLLSLIENNEDGTVVIFAGYETEMRQFLDMNPGLASRISDTLVFPDYSVSEMCQIVELELRRRGHNISRPAMTEVSWVIEYVQEQSKELEEPFDNGRYARNIAEELHIQHACNVSDGIAAGDCILCQDVDVNRLIHKSTVGRKHNIALDAAEIQQAEAGLEDDFEDIDGWDERQG